MDVDDGTGLARKSGDPLGVRVKPSSKSMRESSFRFLVGLGTAVFLFGTLFSQTKGPDRTPDLIIFVTAAVLIIGALLVGQLRRRTSKSPSEWRSGPVSTMILAIELILSMSFIKDLVIYELHKR
jgi:hypothetical protein